MPEHTTIKSARGNAVRHMPRLSQGEPLAAISVTFENIRPLFGDTAHPYLAGPDRGLDVIAPFRDLRRQFGAHQLETGELELLIQPFDDAKRIANQLLIRDRGESAFGKACDAGEELGFEASPFGEQNMSDLVIRKTRAKSVFV